MACRDVPVAVGGAVDREATIERQRVRGPAGVLLRRDDVELAEPLACLDECGQPGREVTVVIGNEDAHREDCRQSPSASRGEGALRIIFGDRRSSGDSKGPTMQAWLCENPTGVEALQWKELPTPEPKAGEVRIAIHAASLNFPDLLIVQNKYQICLLYTSDAADERSSVD